MIKQEWMVIIAGEQLIDELSAETRARVHRNERGFASEDLTAVQDELEELDAAIFDLDREPVEYWDWPEHYGRA